ncbi:MAG TPA: DciA family protein [Arachnia sp.]|nr:DciA family protein [Arachnia sp.]
MTTPNHEPEGLEVARQVARAARGDAAPPPRPRKRTKKADDGPELLGDLLKDVIDTQGWSTDVKLHHLLGGWPALVGEVNAAHSTPESFADKVLTVRAESTTWATSLRQIAPQLVARLNEQLGQGSIARVVVVGPNSPSWKKGRRSVAGRGPRDTYG